MRVSSLENVLSFATLSQKLSFVFIDLPSQRATIWSDFETVSRYGISQLQRGTALLSQPMPEANRPSLTQLQRLKVLTLCKH